MKVVRSIQTSAAEGGHGLNRAFTGLAIAAILAGVTRLMSLIGTAYIARTVGAEAFGRLGFAEALVLYLMLISDLGLQTLGVREVARIRDRPAEVRRLVSRIVSVQLTFSLVLFALLNIIAWLVFRDEPETRGLLTLYGLGLLFPYVFAIEWWLNGMERLALTSAGRLLREAAFLIALVIGFHSATMLYMVPVLQGLIGAVVAALICLAFARSVAGWFQFSFDLQVWRKLLARSWPFAVTGIIGHLWLRSGVIFLGTFGDESETGLYTASFKLFIIGIEVHSLLGLAFVPIFSRTYQQEPVAFRRTVMVYRVFTCLVGVGCMIAALFMSDLLIDYIYGPDFIGGAFVLTLLLLALACWFFGSSFGLPLNATRYESAVMVQTLAGAAVCLVLSLILIPSRGMNGAGLAYLGSILVSTAMNIWFYVRLIAPSIRV